VKQCAHERGGVALQLRHRNEMKEGVGSEDREDQAEQDPADVNQILHPFVKAVSRTD